MRILRILLLLTLITLSISAQEKGLMNTTQSKYVRMHNVDMDAVMWTDGFWAERFGVYKDSMILNMWRTLNDPEVAHAYRNFEIAAGKAEGSHKGPPFHDGDFYKWFEGVASIYALTKDPKLDQMMDSIIVTLAEVQRADGYIHTPVNIEENKRTHGEVAFDNRLNFETYNLGHLMTAACVHYRATGKENMLDMAVKAADFLQHFYQTDSVELAGNAICPSHYMGVVEMYRTTGNKDYLKLAEGLISIRDLVVDGTDDNQDRIPFREQTKAMGHAVRANYLYAGVADVYAETGEELLMNNLESIWNDIVNRKMYITGATGALYDGTSPDGTSYEPDSVQKVHQAYGRAFQLPNSTAHNETCANIGNVLFNWRMLNVTGEEKFADIVETAIYNSVLSGVSLDGNRFFYTNPLRVSAEFPYTMRWSKEREVYIELCNCCPPNTVRTLCETHNYLYSVSDKGLWLHTYGGNELDTRLTNGTGIKATQVSEYPADGRVKLTVESISGDKDISLFLRIPQWSGDASLKINGESVTIDSPKGSYAEVKRVWKDGDVIELDLDMQTMIMEANPLAEEIRNQVAIKRGPLVYCLESIDIADGHSIDNILIPTDIDLKPTTIMIDGSPVICLEGEAELLSDNNTWENQLYRPVSNNKQKVDIRLVPYYAWGNRGKTEMTVWMPLSR